MLWWVAALGSPNADTSGEPNALDEVVVTARQRAEKIQDVPGVIRVFTPGEIKSAGIERPQDFITLTPGVSAISTSEVADMQVNIRGINAGRDAESSYALVVDGVLMTNPTALNQEFADIEQIEVVKGPQGAVYGRNAEAGALIITTRAPSAEPTGRATLGIGNNGLVKGSLFYGGPLTDDLFARAGIDHRQTDGFFRNRYLDRKVVDRYSETGTHLRLRWQPSERSRVDLGTRYSRVSGASVAFNAAFELPGLVPFLGSNAFQNVNDHPFDYIANIVPRNEQRNLNIAAKGEFDLTFATLTAIGAHNDQRNFFLADGASAGFNIYSTEPTCIATFGARRADTPLLPPAFYGATPASSVLPPFSPTTCDGFQFQIRNQRDESAELRLSSPDRVAWRWIAGLYYTNIDRRVAVEQGADLGRGIELRAYNPPTSISPTDLLYDDNFASKVYAGFGSLAVHPWNSVEVALALRHDTEHRNVSNNVPRASAPFLQPAVCRPNCLINPAYNADPALLKIASRAKTYAQLQPKLSVNWKPRETLALFASYGTGFRSGGFNSQGSAATIRTYYQNAFGAQLYNVRDDFNRELSKSSEVGFKFATAGGRLLWEGAAYHTTVDQMQFFEFFAGPFGLLRVVTNIDAVSINGTETEVRWKASDHWSLLGGASVTRGRIDANANRPYTVGNEVPYVPAYLANLGVEATMPIAPLQTTLAVRVDLIGTGPTWFHTVQDNQVQTSNGTIGDYSKTRRDAFALVNARILLRRQRWGAELWGRNLTNRRYLQEVITAPEGGAAFVHDSPRRSFGIDFNYSLGE
jgi:iron complex outermembrane receptor protein